MWAWILLLLSFVAFIVFVSLTVFAAIRQSGYVKTFGIGMAASIVVFVIAGLGMPFEKTLELDYQLSSRVKSV